MGAVSALLVLTTALFVTLAPHRLCGCMTWETISSELATHSRHRFWTVVFRMLFMASGVKVVPASHDACAITVWDLPGCCTQCTCILHAIHHESSSSPPLHMCLCGRVDHLDATDGQWGLGQNASRVSPLARARIHEALLCLVVLISRWTAAAACKPIYPDIVLGFSTLTLSWDFRHAGWTTILARSL